jgi:hypothetical protein
MSNGDEGLDSRGRRVQGFLGIAGEDNGMNPTLENALLNAAEQAVRPGSVVAGKPLYFDIVHMEAEIANQHIRTYKVIVTPKDA